MKKTVLAMILICLAALAAGCGSNEKAAAKMNGGQTGVADVLEAGMEAAENEAAEKTGTSPETKELSTEAATEKPEQQVTNPADTSQNTQLELDEEEAAAMRSTEGVDIDLTVLTSTMVYSQVYNLMIAPEDYLGQVVKMRGIFDVYTDESTGNQYFACIIQDATACCAQGIEFELEGEYSYPEDYPEVGTEVTVVGTFDTYMEGSYRYCTLRKAAFAQ